MSPKLAIPGGETRVTMASGIGLKEPKSTTTTKILVQDHVHKNTIYALKQSRKPQLMNRPK